MSYEIAIEMAFETWTDYLKRKTWVRELVGDDL